MHAIGSWQLNWNNQILCQLTAGTKVARLAEQKVNIHYGIYKYENHLDLCARINDVQDQSKAHVGRSLVCNASGGTAISRFINTPNISRGPADRGQVALKRFNCQIYAFRYQAS